MGWGYYRPCIMYGFKEIESNQYNDQICYEFLEKYEIECYASFSNKDHAHEIIYGLVCESIEKMNEVDKNKIEEVYKIVSNFREYEKPSFHLALIGDTDRGHLPAYNPENIIPTK